MEGRNITSEGVEYGLDKLPESPAASIQDIGNIVAEPFRVMAGALDGSNPATTIDVKVELPEFLPKVFEGEVEVTIPPVGVTLVSGALLFYALRRIFHRKNRANLGYRPATRQRPHSRNNY